MQNILDSQIPDDVPVEVPQFQQVLLIAVKWEGVDDSTVNALEQVVLGFKQSRSSGDFSILFGRMTIIQGTEEVVVELVLDYGGCAIDLSAFP